jgi:hypothetical protein
MDVPFPRKHACNFVHRPVDLHTGAPGVKQGIVKAPLKMICTSVSHAETTPAWSRGRQQT